MNMNISVFVDKISVNQFDFQNFLNQHRNEFVVLVTGSWDYITHTGSYTYQTNYCGKSIIRTKQLKDLKSSNLAMLLAVEDACSQIKLRDIDIYILSPAELGFRKGVSGKGANRETVQRIFEICSEKYMNFHSIVLLGGGDAVKEWLHLKTQKAHDTSNTSNSISGKLVRDRIPEIIEADGTICSWECLSDEDYLTMLEKTLKTGAAEYQVTKSLEKLADLLEVIHAVVKARGWTWEELEQVRTEKSAKQGGFERKILLKDIRNERNLVVGTGYRKDQEALKNVGKQKELI